MNFSQRFHRANSFSPRPIPSTERGGKLKIRQEKNTPMTKAIERREMGGELDGGAS
jgi:hypothetical protein